MHSLREKESEMAKSGGIKIKMVKSVRHLGNYFDCAFTFHWFHLNEQAIKVRKVNL